MLFPIQNKFRSIIELSGFWKFKVDKEKKGEENNWHNGFDSDIEIAVPGSWNEQLEELGLLHYMGTCWYSRKITLPENLTGGKIFLRFGSVDYFSKVWVNGKLAGENNIGFMPFEFDLNGLAEVGKEAEIIVMVNNELTGETIPQGISSEQYQNENRLREETNPPARFDFSPFGGIHRPVRVIALPKSHVSSVIIDSQIKADGAEIILNAEITGRADAIRVSISDGKKEWVVDSEINSGTAAAKIAINNAKLWSPENPFLYDVKVNLLESGKSIDEYSLPFGIREIKIENNRLMLNGKEIYLKGFGKHEDFSVIGKGLFLPLIVKDFELLKWINANSFRTSHYPYAEEILQYADRKGILVIDEVPAVSLDLRVANENTLVNHKDFVKRLVERDYNHPSVIIWAAGNEPNIVGYDGYYDGSGRKYWKEVFDYFRTLDDSRPITVPNCTRAGIYDPVFEFSDIVSINRYYGWYEHPGDLEFAAERLSAEMDKLFELYGKPVLFTEFGADTMPGFHSTSLQMFTEEYQTKLIEEYIKVIRSKNYTVGEHVWNFADFRTPQHFRRVVLNLKGVFTRERAPKNVAFRLKEIWEKER